ncbi:radical SAM protein [Thermodesulfobacteriota bacterium]
MGKKMKTIFGPVLSRRLGCSLGIDTLPAKICTYDCIYCECGATTEKRTERKEFIPVGEILDELKFKLEDALRPPDTITFAGSGEPTLYSGLGALIRGIKEITTIKVAVLTNGSLLWREDVAADLMAADLVLPSLDAAEEPTFGTLNRPHSVLGIEEILSGLIRFREQFRGRLWLEILLCRGINDGSREIAALKEAVSRIKPHRVQLNTVVRPPAESFAAPLNRNQLERIRASFGGTPVIIGEVPRTKGVASVEGEEMILEIIRRRPLTSEDIADHLGLRKVEILKHLEGLNQDQRVHVSKHKGKVFYLAS